MANTFTMRSALGSGRYRLYDAILPVDTLLNVSAIILSCGGADPEWEIYFDKIVNDLAKPNQPSLTAVTTGGTIPRSTKLFVRITTVDVNGAEGTPTDGHKTITTGASTDTNKVTVSWSSISGSSSYNVYAGGLSGRESFVGNTVSTSLVIVDMPGEALQAIPTTPDIHIIGKKGGVEPIPLSGSGLTVSSRLIVYVTISAGGDPAVSILSV